MLQTLKPSNFSLWVLPTLIIAIIFFINYHTNFLVFHLAIESFSIFVALFIAFVAYYTHSFTKDSYLLFIGLGYFWVAQLDMMHTITYPGMGVFQLDAEDSSLSFWIFARLFEGSLLLGATLFHNRDFKVVYHIAFLAITTVVISAVSLYSQMEGFDNSAGVNSLKMIIEYVIVFILGITLYLNKVDREKFRGNIYKGVQLAIIFTMLSELFLSFYMEGSSDFDTILGHVCKFLSFWIILQTIVISSLKEPVEKLIERERELKELNSSLLRRVEFEVNKQREQEEKLLHQSRRASMSEMLTMISHHWRQPLAKITLYAEKIKDDFEYEEISKKSIEKDSNEIINLSTDLSAVISSFLITAKESGNKKEINVYKLINDIYSLMEAELLSKNIELKIIGDKELSIFATNYDFSQVIIHMLKNAEEELEECQQKEKLITIDIYKESDNCKISIKDNGRGINKDIVEKIFDPFFTTKNMINKTGAGLYVSCLTLKNRLNGKIELGSSSSQTEFLLTIPLKREG